MTDYVVPRISGFRSNTYQIEFGGLPTVMAPRIRDGVLYFEVHPKRGMTFSNEALTEALEQHFAGKV